VFIDDSSRIGVPHFTNNKFDFYNVRDTDFEASDFSGIFLLVMPVNDANPRITGKYIITSQYGPVAGVRVINNFLEAMPFSLDSLLEKAMSEIDDNGEFENKEALIDILYKRYFEILDLGETMPSDYYIKLFSKIVLFEQELRK
jgi:hypothetical protein